MARKRRIAILGGEVEEKRQSRFITGFLRKARTEDMDVCVFSMFRKYQDTPVREAGDSNIFNLFEPAAFDGIVIIKDSIQTNGVCHDLETRINEEFNGPVLVIDRESDFFPSVFEDDYAGMSALVSHMIEVHGYRDIAYVSGKRWHTHAQKRLQGYCDTMKKFGLRPDEDRIFHGDFWYTSGEQAIREFMLSKKGLPEAVVCANDEMAIGVCEALEEQGLNVPEDVAVVGFDSTEEGRTGPKVMTSTVFPDEESGIYAAGYMRDKLDGEKEPAFLDKPRILAGETCGCVLHDRKEGCNRRSSWITERMAEGIHSVNNMMAENLLLQPNLKGYLGTLYSYVYQLRGVENLCLCIGKPWIGMNKDQGLHVANTGYPDKMILALKYNSSGKEGIVGTDEEFDTAILLPELEEEHDEPLAYFFTPLFCEDECFGYAAVSYGSAARTYDIEYRFWMSVVSRSMEALRRRILIENLKEQLDGSMQGKFSSVNAKYELLSEEEKQDYELVKQILDENLLTYFFQPIVSATDGGIYSYEALMRSNTDKKISPLDIIKYAGLQGRLSDVEKATYFNVLGYIEKNEDAFGSAKVFLNSIPGIRLGEEDFNTVKDLLHRNCERTVIELTEEAELGEEELDNMKKLFRELNVEIAIDDYGTGYSNVSNLLRYMPNYVKIDRALLSGIDSKPQKQHFVSEIIKFCHDNDIKSLAEGIETKEELRTVIHMGVDLIQGYYTAKPSADIIPRINDMVRNEIKSYYQERQDGTDKRIHVAGSTNRISLGMLYREGYTDISVGDENAVYKDIAVIGSPGLVTNMHMQILAGYTGVITLENVSFSNIKGRPCIDISENCDVTLRLQGENTLKGIGIRIPEGSRLIFMGEGNLDITVNIPEYYGIGNSVKKAHGEIIFEQDGRISVNASGQEGICIGSGLGGPLRIARGQYQLKGGGTRCVTVGSITGDSRFEIRDCMLEAEVNAEYGVCVGSIEGDSGFYLSKSTFNIMASGDHISGVGTIDGVESNVLLEDSRVRIDLRADESTCIGALHGRTDCALSHSSVSCENSGNEALVFGGKEQDVKIEMDKADVKIDIHTGLNRDTYAENDDIRIFDGRLRCMVNGREVERKPIYRNYDN